MVIEDGKSNGDCTGRALEVKFVKREAGENGIGMGVLNVVTTGVPGTSDGFRTYKRRKQTRLTSGSECKGDSKTHAEATGQLVVRVFSLPFNLLQIQLIMCTYSMFLYCFFVGFKFGHVLVLNRL